MIIQYSSAHAAQEHRITAYDQLFQDGHRRRLRQEEYAHWCGTLPVYPVSCPDGCWSPTAAHAAVPGVCSWQCIDCMEHRAAPAAALADVHNIDQRLGGQGPVNVYKVVNLDQGIHHAPCVRLNLSYFHEASNRHVASH